MSIERTYAKVQAKIDYAIEGKPQQFQFGFDRGFNAAWQAATAQQSKRIQELESAINDLLVAYNDCAITSTAIMEAQQTLRNQMENKND